jgi:TonB family protein
VIGLILAGVAKANLAAGVAVLIVAALRRPLRARFGARAAYGLWLAPLAVAVAVLAPHPQMVTPITPIMAGAVAAADAFVAEGPDVAARDVVPDPQGLLFAVWLAGAAVMAGLLAWRQVRFVGSLGRLQPMAGAGGRLFRAQRDGVGPAVVGVLRPKIITPADFETRFGAPERALILAHEGAHLKAGDARANALACAIQCLGWFNPLAHLGAGLMRVDQELACDAAVIGRFPDARRTYAELLLKTQLATQPLPLGCHWPAGAEHPLKARIAMLRSPLPHRAMRGLGLCVAAATALGGATLAWAAQPGPHGSALAPTAVIANNGHLEPAQAAKLVGPGETVLCKPDDRRELHNCRILGTPFAAIATPADVAREWPAQAKKAGLTGWVTLRCTANYDDQRLEKCEGFHYGGAAERPDLKAAFEGAAVRVISVIRLKAHPGPGDMAMDATPKFFTIEFNDHPNMPGGAPPNPPPTRYPDFLPGPPVPARPRASADPVSRVPVAYVAPAPAAPVVVKPDWVAKPTGVEFADAYPADALKADLDGAATLACAVSLEGRLTDCKVADETPAQAGFGEAALKLSERFQLKPMSRDGQPVAGGRIRIPIRFVLPQGHAPAAPVETPR